MKRIINTILTVATLSTVGFTLNSCQDALDITQAGELKPEDVFTTVANLNDVLNGSVYAQLEPIEEIYFSAVFTDEVKPGHGSGGQEYELHRLFLDPSSPVVNSSASIGVTPPSFGIWMNEYRVINRINRLLEGAQKITPNTAAEKAQYNSIIAQARAMRAYCYLQLEAYFAPDMKDPNGLGVILIKDVPATDAKLPRSKNQDVYDFINADLDYARSILTYSATAPTRYAVGKAFVNSVTARFNLYRGNMALAKQYAKEVIDNSGLTLTPATPSSILIDPLKPELGYQPVGNVPWSNAFYPNAGSFNPYKNMWNDTQRGEIIFSLNRLALGAGAPIGPRWNTNSSSISGNPMWNWGRNIYNMFTNNDIRKYTYVDPSSTPNVNWNQPNVNTRLDRLVVDKYPGKTGSATRNDIKVFRLSEMYFILAEAEAATGNLAAAQTLIQQVRNARYFDAVPTTPTYTSTQVAYADILKERRIELALEGHRYLDLKRLAVAAGVSMDRNVTDDVIPAKNLPNGDYRYTLPIPIKEISANPNCVQNPGYN
ncbi:hypothetical protein BBI01_16160 [Chryseobacterium artocarpi]|uniref:Carbohydrate-binding protein SusD n=1 Tax=Chryseobacterium artocarpi TaxID=1414727 RepID=A0A1B8ZDJ5_9FLAO|nr:RagB/SusD family nutrient uptake outer membrane protein [Chryseobacterium artocarpi]OCA69665.1 hypothetical protein BBI01_16160 [Chryseobacterium artocarpi]